MFERGVDPSENGVTGVNIGRKHETAANDRLRDFAFKTHFGDAPKQGDNEMLLARADITFAKVDEVGASEVAVVN